MEYELNEDGLLIAYDAGKTLNIINLPLEKHKITDEERSKELNDLSYLKL